MKGNDGKYLTILAELENHYRNLGIGWIHPALLLNLLTYREKALSTLKRLIQESRGTGQKVKFYMGVFKFLRDTIKMGAPKEIYELKEKGVEINTLNSFSLYLNIIRVNVKKIISFARWIKTVDEPERIELIRFLANRMDNLLYAKVIEEMIFLESQELLENISTVIKKVPCTPFSVVILREYLRSGLSSGYQDKFREILKGYSRKDCAIPSYTFNEEDLSRFTVYSTPPTMSGTQVFLIARKENMGSVDLFNLTVTPSLGITAFSFQENVPSVLYRDFEEDNSREMERVKPDFLVQILQDSLLNMKLLSLERNPDFAFYRKFMGEEALTPAPFQFSDEVTVTEINGKGKIFYNPYIRKWIYTSPLLKKILGNKEINTYEKLKEELIIHSDIILDSLKRLTAWARSAGLPDYIEILHLYRLSQDRKKFIEYMTSEIWQNRINFYMASG